MVSNCLLKYVIDGKIVGRIEVAGRRRKQILYEFKENKKYWELKRNF
jgi:hypothetical protein